MVEEINPSKKMPIIQAILAFLFGIVLPTCDIFTDMRLSMILIRPKNCSFTWKHYLHEFKNGTEPLKNQEIGEYQFHRNDSFIHNICFQICYVIIKTMVTIRLDSIVKLRINVPPDIMFVIMKHLLEKSEMV